MFKDFIKKFDDYLANIVRSRAARQIEKVYNQGKIKDGDRIKVTFNKPSFLERQLQTEEENYFFDNDEFPVSNIGKVVSAKTDSGTPYVRLDDENSGFTIDLSYDNWEKLNDRFHPAIASEHRNS